ncbi:LacI family DNA-binding transcriptional regulator [Paraburkholderia tropica]|uniref:substrate-binding domain-containing protein n=1 Tax=Paraburkholderia tropica TaxID=92647 RepID=UPI0016004332|nr:substrate-binding domain-containing protein [Paraburkholderia tropica]QNB16074.1 LacI family DNA-binding transcriptional regulator [Paraburkholderia tropica]
MKTSLKALASSLGLSKTTVSRALNGYDDVSEATRTRVIEAAQALGYHADATARKLATGRANAIAIVYPFAAGDLGDPRFCEVVAGITEGLGDLDLIIVSARENAELDTYRRLVDNRVVDGFIVARTLVDDPRIAFLLECDFPFVAYGRTNSVQPHFWFDFDNEAGAHAATKRLIDFGHRRIGLIGAPLSLNFASQRREGFLRALREARIKAVARNVRQGAFDRDTGYQAALALLDSANPPTAILVDNNLAGIGALCALRERRRKPGKDISLIVYDGVPADCAIPYTVTAISQPTGRDSGLALAALVIAAIERRAPPEHRLAVPHIEAGNTDGPPRD